MADSVLPALVKRRADLAGQLGTMQTAVQQLHADLACIDAVIRQFDPDYKLETIRPTYRKAASPAEFGAMSRAVLDTLRRAPGPMAVKAIAQAIVAERGLDQHDQTVRRAMQKRVDMALRYQRTNGMVAEVAGVGAEVAWKVAG